MSKKLQSETIQIDRGYRTKKVREFLGDISPSAFWKMVKAGRIKTVKISERVIVVKGEEILRILEGVGS